ncbi:hypothetical protein KAI78_07235 [bacterium]|nr:hypothetical protein [bacterium]
MILKRFGLVLLILLCVFVIPFSQQSDRVAGISGLTVEDFKYDHGASVIIKFKLSPDDNISLFDYDKEKLAAVYTEESEDGVTVFELSPEGKLSAYEILQSGEKNEVAITDENSLLKKNPVRYYRIYAKIGALAEEDIDGGKYVNPDGFNEIRNISIIGLPKYTYEQSVLDDIALKDKFRLPYYNMTNKEYEVRIKNLDDYKELLLNSLKEEKKAIKAALKAGDLGKEEAKADLAELKTRLKEAKKNFTMSFTVVVESASGILTFGEYYEAIHPRVEWINLDKSWVYLFSIAFIIMLLIVYKLTKGGKEYFIRPIAGLSAVEEAVGRATEMGRPVLYISGLSSISDIATLASINILGQIAKKVAIYETPLIVPAYDPIVFTVIREVVREAYIDVGKPDAFQEENVFYLTSAQFAYAAGVNGIMVREKPATVFYMGMFFAEALLMSETGNQVGAIQIAGTDAITQVPFFITSCDYTLIGEELYAASAYLSRDPLLLSTLKAQDYGKQVIMLIIIIGIILELMGVHWFTYILQNIPD